MLILILGLLILVFAIFITLIIKRKVDKYASWVRYLSVAVCWVTGIIASAVIIAICCLAPRVATESVLDAKIEMYQEENLSIEQDIDKIVDAYMKHEKATFEGVKTEGSSINLVTLFPELKSDELVKQQLGIYLANNTRIRNLKEKKIDIAKTKWILYFGK